MLEPGVREDLARLIEALTVAEEKGVRVELILRLGADEFLCPSERSTREGTFLPARLTAPEGEALRESLGLGRCQGVAEPLEP